jgi:GNAT superfamily N-acetyltransferase
VPDLEVRPAQPNDVEGVTSLLADALALAATLRGGPSLLEALGAASGAPEELATALCDGTAGSLAAHVAILDGAVTGLAVTSRHAAAADLVGVHVARPMRRRRLGTALLDAVRAAAASRGEPLEALALPGDQSMKSLLEAAGYKARLLRMSAER